MAKGGSKIRQKGTAMPEDAGVNSLAPQVRVREMQTKLHRWAVADSGCRFDDLYNLVCDPAFLLIAWERVQAIAAPALPVWTVTRSATSANRWV